MIQQPPLLPLAYDSSKASDTRTALSTLPRPREVIDRDAGGTIFHTRGNDSSKRKMDLSPQQASRKTRKYETSDMIMSDDSDVYGDDFPGTSTQKQLRTNIDSSDFDTKFILPRMPSSPPLQFTDNMSDTDSNRFADKSFIIPSSPEKADEFQSPLIPKDQQPFSENVENTRSKSFPYFKHAKSEDFDFGLDRFNRVQGVHSDHPSSELGHEEQLSQRFNGSADEYARSLVGKCFENQKTEVNLDSLDLTKIPEEIEDLKDLVTFNGEGFIIRPKIQIYLSNNRIKNITPRLFDLEDMVEVLSLRSNKLKNIPGAISRLTDLNYLNVASNNIQTLPYQILELHKLQNLLLRPNPSLMELDQFPDAIEVPDLPELDTKDKRKRFISKITYINRHEHTINPLSIMLTRNLSILSQVSEADLDIPSNLHDSSIHKEEQLLLQRQTTNVPRLTELCLRKFTNYKTSKSEAKKWSKSVGLSTSKLVAKALQQGAFGETCFSCGTTVVQHVAEVIEWWDLLETKLVPIKKQFCCGRCVKVWQNQNM